jgi:hypothetical protein
MKTAIVFTGFVRSLPIYGEQLSRKLRECFPNADLYFCTWDIVDINNPTKINENLFKHSFPNCKGIQILQWEYHRHLIGKTVPIDRPNDIFKVNKNAIKEGVESTNRIRNQWYLLNIAKDMIPSGEYDTIVRSRFDLNFTDFTVKEIKPGITIPYNYYTKYCRDNHDIQSGFCDHLAYGDEASMMQYLSMYRHYDRMYAEYNANIAHAEGILKFYLTDYSNLTINMNDAISYQIVKTPNDVNNTPLIKYKYWTDDDYWSPRD